MLHSLVRHITEGLIVFESLELLGFVLPNCLHLAIVGRCLLVLRHNRSKWSLHSGIVHTSEGHPSCIPIVDRTLQQAAILVIGARMPSRSKLVVAVPRVDGHRKSRIGGLHVRARQVGRRWDRHPRHPPRLQRRDPARDLRGQVVRAQDVLAVLALACGARLFLGRNVVEVVGLGWLSCVLDGVPLGQRLRGAAVDGAHLLLLLGVDADHAEDFGVEVGDAACELAPLNVLILEVSGCLLIFNLFL